MNYYLRERKYPRVYNKKENGQEQTERVFDISMAAAAGIVAFAFVKGIFWGYLLKRRLG